MPEPEVTKVFTRDKSSGRIHARIMVDGATLTDERCNLDEAGDYEVVGDEVLEAAEPGDLCQRCIPRLVADE